MARVTAFHGLEYAAAAGALDSLVAPPYDVIPEADLSGWQGRSPYNITHLTRPGTEYAAAATRLDAWRTGGVLELDSMPTMRGYEVEFGGGRRRRGLLVAVGLEPYERRVVLPHELTHRGPKADRLELYRATATALEPLWMVYQGAGTPLPALLERCFTGPPAREFQLGDDTHRIWRINDGELLAQITAGFAPLPLLIADGHHRYETALAYADETGAGPADASRVGLVLLSDLADPELDVLPTHRVMTAGAVAVTGGEPMPSLEATLAAISGRVAAGYYRAGAYSVLPLEGDLALVELHRQVIDNMLGRRTAEDGLVYTRDAGEAVRMVDAGDGQAAFFLDRPDLSVVLELAQAGRTLPQKSTYFAPKPPSGMVLLPLDRPRS